MTVLAHLAAPPGEIYWRHTKPKSRGAKMLLRTIGGVAVIGCWYGELGENFTAWCPLPKDHKPSRDCTANSAASWLSTSKIFGITITGETKLHILIATLYSIVLWLSLLAYTLIVGGFWLVALIAGPIIISSFVIGLLAADMLIARLEKRFGWRTVKPVPE